MTKLVESSVGVRTTEDMARAIDAVLKSLPKDKAYAVRTKADTTTEVQEAERTDVSYVSTRVMDRDRDIVDPAGIELEDFRRNPIVLYGHNRDAPVGKALWVKADANGLIAKTAYTARPKNYVGEWLPDFVYSMVAADVLRGKSITFIPTEIRDPNDQELTEFPEVQSVITRCMLIEYSVVSVPCNPLALVEAIGKGVGLSHWGFKVLGKVKPKRAEPKPTPKHFQPMADELARFGFDADAIAEQAVKNILARWEV